MFSRVFSKGFFRQGFPGWYRGRFSEVVPGNPGKFALNLAVANFGLGGSIASLGLQAVQPHFGLDDETPSFGLDDETATFTLERQF